MIFEEESEWIEFEATFPAMVSLKRPIVVPDGPPAKMVSPLVTELSLMVQLASDKLLPSFAKTMEELFDRVPGKIVQPVALVVLPPSCRSPHQSCCPMYYQKSCSFGERRWLRQR